MQEKDDYPDLSKQLLGGQIDEDAFVEAFTPNLNARYAMAGLEMLNLRISPMVYAGQDYSNELGRSYAQFVTKVSQSICDKIAEEQGELQRPDRESTHA